MLQFDVRVTVREVKQPSAKRETEFDYNKSLATYLQLAVEELIRSSVHTTNYRTFDFVISDSKVVK